MTSRRALRLAAPLLFAALALAAQRNLVPLAGTHVYAQGIPGSDSLLHVWTLAWDQHALWTAPGALIDANIFHPQHGTLLYSDHLLGLALLLAPLRLVTDAPVLVHNVALLAAPALDALAMYVLVLGLVRRPGPAVVAGLLYGFAPLRFEADRTQIQMLVAWWPPLVLHWGRRALAHGRRRDAVLAALALLLQGLTGIYLTAFFAPFVLLAHLWWLRRWPLRSHPRAWLWLLAAEGVAVAVLLPSAIAYRAVQADLGTMRSIVLNALLSLPFRGLGQYLPLWSLGAATLALGLGWRSTPRSARGELPLLAAIALGALVLAAGPSVDLPGDLGSVRGPYAALVPLPGYNALRAPGRMVHVAILGWAAVAGIGVAALTARLPSRLRAGAVLAAAVGVLWECVPPLFPLMRVATPATLPPVYAWLAARPDSVHIAELPLGTALGIEQGYQYASTRHWKRMLNGSMGIVPPIHPYMAARLAEPARHDVLAEMTALGITHLVVHEDGVPLPQLAALATAARGAAAPLKVRRRFPGVVVYALRPRMPVPRHEPAGPLLARDGWRASASANGVDAGLAIDGDARTAWRAWGGLERRLRTRWYDRRPFLDRWRRFLDAQPVRFQVDLGAPRRLTAIVAELGGSDPTAPPTLAAEVSLDGRAWRTLPALLVPVPDVRALVEHAAEGRFALVLDAAVAARYLRLSCTGLEWQIRELRVHGT